MREQDVEDPRQAAAELRDSTGFGIGDEDPSLMVDDVGGSRERHLQKEDFLGAFAVLESAAGILMVQNERQIAGVPTLVWDLPGGQVEPGELLADTLRRELLEETGVQCTTEPEFLFYQEGARHVGGVRQYAWRSFFFRVLEYSGKPKAAAEIRSVRWMARAEMAKELCAPYHDSFLSWLVGGGTAFRSAWDD